MKSRSCFGDPSVFSFDASACTDCAGFTECAESSYQALIRLNVGSSADKLIERHINFLSFSHDPKQRSLTDVEESTAKALPLKVACQYRRIVGEGFVPVMKTGLALRMNPFKREGYKYLHVAFAQLIAGGFTKKSLRQHYMQHCSWSEGTALSAVNMIWHLFALTGVATIKEGVMVPCVNPDNNSLN